MKPVDNRRIQADLRDLPEGVKSALMVEAATVGLSLKQFIRTLLIERALQNEPVVMRQADAWKPLT